MPKSDLPFGSEFSPSQIDLAHVLDLADKHGGDWRAFEIAVRDAYFKDHATSAYNTRKLANNTKLGMIAYGIIDRDARLTDFGRALHAVRQDQPTLYAALARHIILNRNGMAFVQCIQNMQAAGETVDLLKLREALQDRGIHVPRGGKHPSIMRLWLEKADIFTEGYRVNEQRLRAIAGISSAEVEALATLTAEQRCYLKTLVNIGGAVPQPSNEVEKLATATYGVKFNEKNLPKSVLYPLRDAGYITLERGTKTDGRGAKPFMVARTAKLIAEVVTPLLEQMEKLTSADLRPLLRKPLAEIMAELESADRHVAGLALEALAFKLMRLIDLTYVATRLRGNATGGAEVDLIFESARLVFSRWQVQCKNTAHVSLEDVAKEVGLTHMLKSNVIVIVSTGQIGPEARKYAAIVSNVKPLHFVLLDRDDLAQIANNPIALAQFIADQSPIALCRKDGFSYIKERDPHAGIAPVAVA